eukprot:TRINITY_DN23623_c0_g1_i1.p1 TRINITY_DN23623_c0_g1~~TRINITY_DN23623_c0_g1_i1.p1  ORF type:complete len:415 (-),score=67.48 TRINITY_DN23623_c0_g1_i1:55-1299(-)
MAASADCAMLMPDLALSLESVSETLCDLRHRIEHIEHVQRTNDRRLEDQIRLTIQGAMDRDLEEKARACVAELQAELEGVLLVELSRRLTEFEELVKTSMNSDENSTPELKSATSKNSREGWMPDLLAVSEEEVEDATEWVGRVLGCVQMRSETCQAKAMDTIQCHVSQDAAKMETPSPQGRQEIDVTRHDPMGDDVRPSDPHHDVTASMSPALPSRHLHLPQQLATSSATSKNGRQAPGVLTAGASFESFELADVVAEASKAKGLADSNEHCTESIVVRQRSSSLPEIHKLTSQIDIAVEPQNRLPGQRDISACRPPPTQLSPRSSPWQSTRQISMPRQVASTPMPIMPRSSLCMPGQSKAVPRQVYSMPDFRMQQYALAIPHAANSPTPQLMQAGHTRAVAANSPADGTLSI